MEISAIDMLEKWLAELARGLKVDSHELATKVRLGHPSEASEADLLVLAAETAATLVTHHPDWAILGGRILLEELSRRTPERFSQYVELQQHELDPSLVSFVRAHADEIDAHITTSNANGPSQFNQFITFFAVRTLQTSYLHEGERPEYLWMRVALGINFPDLAQAFESYDLMSQRLFTHATPTLFNAGMRKGQLASCFLMAMKDDSVNGIFETLQECALIMHSVGGIGLHCSNIPAAAPPAVPGIVPMLRVFNNAARFVSQGAGKRPGAISITLEPWHADVFDFLDLRKNHGKDEFRARDLFYALWIPDLFMRCVKNDEEWFLFSPSTAPGLQDCVGAEFDALYLRYVNEKKYIRSVPARKLWASILDAQIETGNPSLLYKDSCNSKSNQQNLGIIKSSNLCTEIIEYSSPDEIAVCNLASIGLPQFVSNNTNQNKEFDFDNLHKVTKIVTRSLNNVIDRSHYPIDSARRGNLRHRPLALGVQGLADVFFKMELDFDSPEANKLNKQIFETIYHGSLEASMELAKSNVKTYDSYDGSPICTKGQLQFDLWNVEVDNSLWDWTGLRNMIKKHGLYNSLLTAVMPTASTAQILGFTESIEPLTSNMYSRRTLSGEFQVVNPYMVTALEKLGLWTNEIREEIIAFNGSIQHLTQIPPHIRSRFKTAWELSMKAVINQSVSRAPFIDQSQSLNLFLANPTHRQLTSMHFHAWSQGLKTGIYYLRTQPAAAPIPFTISVETHKRSRRATPKIPPAKRECLDESVCDVCT